MDTAIEWTGQKAQLLQETLGYSVRDFASRLGINPRTVTKWRKQGESLTCNDEMQEVLTLTLDMASEQQREDFYAQLAVLQPADEAAEQAQAGPFTLLSHKFIPVFIGPALQPLFDTASPHPQGPGGLEQRVIPLHHPTANSASAHLMACGVAVVHLVEERTAETITEVALWRYRTYPTDRDWVGASLSTLLNSMTASRQAEVAPEYVLSLYELRDHAWSEATLPTALHLLTTPSVLVNRRDPTSIVPIPDVETDKFRSAWAHPDVMAFSGGSSPGLAGWSGVTYRPQADEHALTISEIVALEIDVQGLWALSSRILSEIEDGRDPVMPDPYGWRYLRGAYSRLRASRPAETAQHRAMREAILATSDLPDRLRDAQDALRDARA